MSRILIASEAWQAICREADRCFPHETALYPLAALVPDAACSPLEGLRWEAAADLVLFRVLLPASEAADFGPTHARFHGGLAGRAADELQARAAELVTRHPRLSFLTKLHSHPHPGGDFLSAGDVALNVCRPSARSWWEARGLDEALLLVLYRRAPGRAQATPWPWATSSGMPAPTDRPEDEHEHELRWAVAAFVVSWEGEVHRLPDAEVLGEGDERLARALAPPYWATAEGAAWCDRTKAALRRAGYQVSRNLLGRGWRRYLLQRDGLSPRVLCLPPDLPAAPARLLEIIDARANRFALRACLGPCSSLEELAIVEALA
ncbi:MAG: hypothetical protein FJ125_05070 [Deltaproteobacteria bacterium]|nr:hypothetical protein [Deltaproteobacteria bacterium]